MEIWKSVTAVKRHGNSFYFFPSLENRRKWRLSRKPYWTPAQIKWLDEENFDFLIQIKKLKLAKCSLRVKYWMKDVLHVNLGVAYKETFCLCGDLIGSDHFVTSTNCPFIQAGQYVLENMTDFDVDAWILARFLTWTLNLYYRDDEEDRGSLQKFVSGIICENFRVFSDEWDHQKVLAILVKYIEQMINDHVDHRIFDILSVLRLKFLNQSSSFLALEWSKNSN
jgi:hypothetical protein